MLDIEIAWRKKELINIKSVLSLESETTGKNIYSRVCILLLYAHWEGFIRRSVKYYLKYINSQGLRLKDLKNKLIALDLKGEGLIEINSKSMLKFYKMTEFISNIEEKSVKLPDDDAIEEPAIMGTALLKEIIFTLDLDYTPFSLLEKKLDGSLIKKRNNIAHGKRDDIDIDDLSDLLTKVIKLLDNFKDQLINSISSELYRRN